MVSGCFINFTLFDLLNTLPDIYRET